VDLEVRRKDDGVAFAVLDDGPGISKEDAARAVEPFFTTKAEDKGTGLGLAIANEIVKHHNGRLSLAPRDGTRGTEAIVVLPALEKGGSHA
jgi:two-component system OmpR family sensor kinase